MHFLIFGFVVSVDVFKQLPFHPPGLESHHASGHKYRQQLSITNNVANVKTEKNPE